MVEIKAPGLLHVIELFLFNGVLCVKYSHSNESFFASAELFGVDKIVIKLMGMLSTSVFVDIDRFSRVVTIFKQKFHVNESIVVDIHPVETPFLFL